MSESFKKLLDEKLLKTAILKSILENTIDAVIITDLDQKVLLFNKAAEVIFGYDKDEVIGSSISMITKPLDTKKKLTFPFKIDTIGKKKNETLFPIRMSIDKVIVKKTCFFIKIIQDISTRKETEEIRVAYMLLLAETKLKNEFLSILSHELRAPLHAICGFTAGLLEGFDGPLLPAQKTSLENIQNSSEDLLKLLNNMLQTAKSSNDIYNLIIEPCSIISCLNESIETVSFLATSKEIQLEKNFSKDAFIIGNKRTLKEIFLNIFTNAIQFSKKGTIKVSLTLNQKDVIIAIADTGLEISKENLPMIFTPFWMLPSPNSKPSTTVGLALTKLLVELQGGRIEVISEKEKGSIFTIHFPIIEPS